MNCVAIGGITRVVTASCIVHGVLDAQLSYLGIRKSALNIKLVIYLIIMTKYELTGRYIPFTSSAVNGRVGVVRFHRLLLATVLELVACYTGVIRRMIVSLRSFFIVACPEIQVAPALEVVVVMAASESETQYNKLNLKTQTKDDTLPLGLTPNDFF